MLPTNAIRADRFLTFRVGAQLYALPSAHVAEVIRVPALARIPQAPTALLGVTNLRGSVLPIASLSILLNKPAATDSSSARAIVLDIGPAVALIVDSVEALEVISAEQIDTHQNDLSAEGAEKLLGTFALGHDKVVAKILDARSLLEGAFASRARTAAGSPGAARATSTAVAAMPTDSNQKATQMLVTFDVAGQEFALPLVDVQEILPMPPTVTAVAHAEALVRGVIAVRDSLVPLLSLRGLLGFGTAQPSNVLEKIILMKLAGALIGLVADNARAIVAAEIECIDPVPPALAARSGGESRIRSIYRAEAGRRLISILSPEHLFREDVMRKLAAEHQDHDLQVVPRAGGGKAELIFLVFRLGDDEFGLPIDTVVEVAQVPPQITRLPKAPKFLEGVVNLRGEVLPVIDQRRRFGMPKLEANDARKLVVVNTKRHRAGIIVDGVSDVLRVHPENIDPSPDLTEAISRLVHGVINMPESQRIVLLLDPVEVLTQAEQKLLDTFQTASQQANA